MWYPKKTILVRRRKKSGFKEKRRKGKNKSLSRKREGEVEEKPQKKRSESKKEKFHKCLFSALKLPIFFEISKYYLAGSKLKRIK